MNAGEYRAKAIETTRRSELVRDSSLKQALVDLALIYLKMARRAEQNVMTDVVYETPPPRPTHSRPYIIRYSALTVTAVTMLTGSIALALLVALFAQDQLSVLPSFSVVDWSLVLFLSFGGAALANFLWIFALGRKAPSGVALFAMIPPLVAALLGTLILHEIPSFATIVGLILVIVGIVIANRESTA